jgi:hypothetical protein
MLCPFARGSSGSGAVQCGEGGVVARPVQRGGGRLGVEQSASHQWGEGRSE